MRGDFVEPRECISTKPYYAVAVALLIVISSPVMGLSASLEKALSALAQSGNFQFVIDSEAVANIDIQVEKTGGQDAAIKAAATAGLEVFNCGDILVFYPPARRDHWLAWMGYQAFVFEKASFEEVASLLKNRLDEIGFKVTLEINAKEKMFFITASPSVLSMVEHVAYLIERKSMSPEMAIGEVFRVNKKLINISATGQKLSVLAPALAESVGEKAICGSDVKGSITCVLKSVHFRLALELLARAGTAVVYNRDDGLHIELFRFPGTATITH